MPASPALALVAAALVATIALAPTSAHAEPPAHDRFHFELAALPYVTVQQVEGPGRDDLLTRDLGVHTYASFGYAPLPWLEPALTVRFDAGRVRRAIFDRPGADGAAAPAQLVEGDWWELWVELQLRARWRWLFAEVGWAPLILRADESRVDLPNTSGDTDGVFLGSRAVAWSLGVGATVPVGERWDLVLRLSFRIRYLVDRGGEALAGDEENGQMLVWPVVGVHHHW